MSKNMCLVLVVGLLVLSCFFVSGITMTNGEPGATVDDTPVVPDSPGGGSSSSGASSSGFTYSVSAAQFATGYSRELGINDRFKINISNELHYVKLVGVTATTASINVSSVTQEATLALGDTRRFDVDEDSNYDLSVTLSFVNVTSSKATFMVKSISGVVTAETIGVEEGLEKEAVDVADDESMGGLWWIWVVALIVVVVGFGVWFWKKKFRKRGRY